MTIKIILSMLTFVDIAWSNVASQYSSHFRYLVQTEEKYFNQIVSTHIVILLYNSGNREVLCHLAVPDLLAQIVQVPVKTMPV